MNLIAAQYTLIILGLIAVIDEIYYHYYKEKIHLKKDCKLENKLHLIRQISCAIIFFAVAHLKLTGVYAILMLIFLFFDIVNGFYDVYIEPKSRKSSSGLPAGEYFLHMLLSFISGIFYFNYISHLIEQPNSPSKLLFDSKETPFISSILTFYSLGAILFFFFTVYNLRKKKIKPE